MKRSQWTDHEVEELFSKLPGIKDERSAQEVLANIQLATRKKKSVQRWLPAMAGIAAVFLFAIITSSFFFNNPSGDKSSESKVAISDESQASQSSQSSKDEAVIKKEPSSEPKKEIALTKGKEDGSTEDSKIGITSASSEPSIIVPDENDNQTEITIAVPDMNVNYIVPITFTVQGTESKGIPQLETFEKIMQELDEEQLGLGEYYPLPSTILSIDHESRTLNVDLLEGHPFINMDYTFFEALKDTAGYSGIDKVTFSQEGNPGVEFSSFGLKTELEILPFERKRGYLIYQYNNQTKKLLVPTLNGFENFESALHDMKKPLDVSYIYPSIPESFQFTVKQEGHKVIVSFTEETMLDESEVTIRALEAMVLTAREFGFKSITFEHPTIQQVGLIKMNQETTVFVHPNKVN
ncbi:hypothetical protein [Peribacillus alkalitolerans]|uniref:hypothetical protein n=1 Tax=Peribacillus alkalitolerans TaxID=1550385 RepID=UPI0013D3E10F|nr:hypothetical protein [Peribacillus alkalitolerans]